MKISVYKCPLVAKLKYFLRLRSINPLGTRRNSQSFMYQNNFCVFNKQYKIKKSRMKSKFIISLIYRLCYLFTFCTDKFNKLSSLLVNNAMQSKLFCYFIQVFFQVSSTFSNSLPDTIINQVKLSIKC